MPNYSNYSIELPYYYSGDYRIFYDALEKILLSKIKKNIKVNERTGLQQKPVDNGKFNIWFMSAPEGKKIIRPPEEINGITVDCRSKGFRPTFKGYVIHDKEGWPVAELLENNLYIFHNICRDQSNNEKKIFCWVLEEVVDWLDLPEIKREKILASQNNTETPTLPNEKLAPNGMTREQLMLDICLALRYKCSNTNNIEEKIVKAYTKFSSLKLLLHTAEELFGKLYKNNPTLLEKESRIIIHQAKKLAISSPEFYKLAKTAKNGEFHNLFFMKAVEESLFEKIEDYLHLYKNINLNFEYKKEAFVLLEHKIFELLNKETKYDLRRSYEICKQIKDDPSSRFKTFLCHQAQKVTAHPTLENLTLAKRILGSEFSEEMDRLLSESDDRFFKKHYPRIETEFDLGKTIKELHARFNHCFSKNHLRHIALTIKRLEICCHTCISLKSQMSDDEFSYLVEVLSSEKVFTKLHDLYHLAKTVRLTHSARTQVDRLIIEAWQRRINLITTPFGLGNIIPLLHCEEEHCPTFAKILVTCSQRLRFKEKAFLKLLKKRQINYGILAAIKLELQPK